MVNKMVMTTLVLILGFNLGVIAHGEYLKQVWCYQKPTSLATFSVAMSNVPKVLFKYWVG
jgi:hypothetical protein